MLASSLGNAFVFVCLWKKRLLVRIDTYQSRSMYTSSIVGWRVSRCACNLAVSASNVGWRFFVVCQFRFISVGAMFLLPACKNMHDDDRGVVCERHTGSRTHV